MYVELEEPSSSSALNNSSSYNNFNSWTLCGITHTTSSINAMDCISSLVTVPVQEWDALICTSNCVKKHVIETINSQSEYLKNRLE